MADVIDLSKWKKLKSAVEIIRLDAGDGDDPPREYMIFPLGKLITTTKGNFILTEAGAREVMAEYIEHGTDLHFDYEHLSIEPEKNASPELAKAAGWFDLELRHDGLWATNIKWTATAEKMIRAKEYRYISPAFHADENGEIHSLVNIALTNLPATDNLSALIAASMRERAIDTSRRVGTSSTNRSSSKFSFQELKMKKHPLAARLKGQDTAALSKSAGISEERMSHLAAGHPPTTEEMSACLNALSASDDDTKEMSAQHAEYLKTMSADDEDDDGDDEDDKKKAKEKEDAEKNSLNNRGANSEKVPFENTSAGGEVKVEGEDGGKNKPPTAKTTSREEGGLSRDELIALTGSTDPQEQRRKLKAMTENANQTREDREFLKQMRTEALAREKGELVALAKSQNRWTANWESFFASKPNELLKEMLSAGAMPVIGGEELQPLMPSGVDGITLTRLDSRYVTMCRVLGVSDDPKEYARVKADIVSLRSNTFDTTGSPTCRGGAQLGPKMTKALMDSWMGLKPGKTSSNVFRSRQLLKSSAKEDVVGRV